MSAFDPFTATLEQAVAQPDAYETRGAVMRLGGAQRLLERRSYYESTPLDGMAVCAMHGLVAPEWLALAFLTRFRRVVACTARSWDEAFGPAFPLGNHLATSRRARKNRVPAVNAFNDIMARDPERKIDKSLWRDVGKRIGEGATRAEELIREAVALGICQRPARFRKLAGKRYPW